MSSVRGVAFDSLKEGDRVTFEPATGNRGLRAEEVRRKEK